MEGEQENINQAMTDPNDVSVSQEQEDTEPEEKSYFDEPEILYTKRERKKVERLSMDHEQASPREPGLDYSKGKGIKLKELEIVNYELNRTLGSDLKPLHRLLYGKSGKPNVIKKNIREFSGFPFEADTKQHANLKWNLEKFTNTGLRRMCEIFGLELKGNRDELKTKVLTFLMKPYDTKKKVPSKVKPKKKKNEEKKEKRQSEKTEAVDKKEESDDEQEEEEHTDDEEQEDLEEDEKESEKQETINKPKPKSKKTKQKKPVDVKPKQKSPQKRSINKTSSESDDDVLIIKKFRKEAPTDEMIENTIKDLLEEADFEKITMKDVYQQVFERFSDHNLTSRKNFIKDTVKKEILQK